MDFSPLELHRKINPFLLCMGCQGIFITAERKQLTRFSKVACGSHLSWYYSPKLRCGANLRPMMILLEEACHWDWTLRFCMLYFFLSASYSQVKAQELLNVPLFHHHGLQTSETISQIKYFLKISCLDKCAFSL